jgi:hypothetical protein
MIDVTSYGCLHCTEDEKESGPSRNVFLTSEQRLCIMKLNVDCFVSGMGVELKLSPKFLKRIPRSETSCAFFKPCIAEWS